jgi:hypothetical protein
MAIRNGFYVRAFECDINAEAACPETCSILERYVFPSLPKAASTSDQPDLSIRLTRAENHYQLRADDVLVASAGRAVELVPELIRVLDEAVIGRLTTQRAIHAGAVRWNGQALLLPGATHSGKSSLVAELLKRGATYFSDEYALIDSEGRVHPYPRPLLLRNDSLEQFPVLPSEWNVPIADTPAPVGWMMSLKHQSSPAWSVGAISQSEALLMLLQNTPHTLADSPDLVKRFQRAVANATCYAGARPEVPQAVDQILRLVNGTA